MTGATIIRLRVAAANEIANLRICLISIAGLDDFTTMPIRQADVDLERLETHIFD